MTGRELHWTIDGREFHVRLNHHGDEGEFWIDSAQTSYRLLQRTTHGVVIDVDGRIYRVFVLRNRRECTVWCNGRVFRLEQGPKHNLSTGTNAPAGAGQIRASMPGKILRIEAREGASVVEKQSLLTMESMKMETTIYAPISGTVGAVRISPGQVVELGELLLTIE